MILPFLVACSTHHAIMGQVIDRNGEPIERAIVALSPGDVEMVTDESGKFIIDYLRDEEGSRVKLSRRTDYAIEFFKVGYHPTKSDFYFKNGELMLEPVALTEDTIKVDNSNVDIDPDKYPDRAQDAGGSYEGE
ncbi:MAG: carboxypeptidase regulatory-like domain-containing protein [Deltaproteobacteria bacterium]|nr:carboxypeptidase regulatory-like domain-containing protein [Deltaproteobacteria bacterium]